MRAYTHFSTFWPSTRQRQAPATDKRHPQPIGRAWPERRFLSGPRRNTARPAIPDEVEPTVAEALQPLYTFDGQCFCCSANASCVSRDVDEPVCIDLKTPPNTFAQAKIQHLFPNRIFVGWR